MMINKRRIGTVSESKKFIAENVVVRHAFPVKKVTSSHGKGESVIISEEDIDEAALRLAISATGYEVKSVLKAPYEKKGLLYFGK